MPTMHALLKMGILIASVALAYANRRFNAPNAKDHQRMSERDLIIDGIETVSGRYPYMASLAFSDSHKCGGTVSVACSIRATRR